MMLHVAVLVLLAALLTPMDASSATEHGATLTAEGTTTTIVGDRRVAASRQGESIVLRGAGFEPGERIGLWATFADAAVAGVDAGPVEAGDAGMFTTEIELVSYLPVGLHHFSARGRSSGRGAIVPAYLMPGGSPIRENARLVLSPATARQLDTIKLTGQGFTGGEPVALWFTLPDGAVLGLGRLTAGSDGTLDTSLTLPEWLPVGRHILTAQGLASAATAMAELSLRHGNGLGVAGAELAADIGRAKQRTHVHVKAGGLQSRESVSFWLTLPSGAVLGLGDVSTDAEGIVDAGLYLSEALPSGVYYISLRGNRSDLGSFARLVLEPGPKSPGEE
jgi:hypothetical protein